MSQLVGSCSPLPDISKPRWDQSTYYGRARHFFSTANPLNLFVLPSTLEKSKKIVEDYRTGVYPPSLTEDELWRAKTLFDSAYHPESGEKMFLLGRMSAQVPCNMTIVGAMMAFHTRFAHVVFFQWINQSFNAIVNYTNRSGKDKSSNQRLFLSYCCATTGAVGIALTANQLVSRLKKAPPILGSFVPFLAIAVANAINIPMMRSKEFTDGITVEDAEGRTLGQSKVIPYKAIPEVTVSRIGMAVPNMILGPLIFARLSRRPFYKPWMSTPIQIPLCGFFLTFSTPLCCAFFPQKSSVPVTSLEADLQKRIAAMPNARRSSTTTRDSRRRRGLQLLRDILGRVKLLFFQSMPALVTPQPTEVAIKYVGDPRRPVERPQKEPVTE